MNSNESRLTKALAALGLILTTMIWGSAFVVMKNSVDVIPPAYLLAIRFTLASLALVLVFHKSLRHGNRKGFSCGVVLGFFLELSYLFQTYGLKHTTASKNAFITTLYVIIVPLLHWAISRKRPGALKLAAAGIAVVGLALLSLRGDFTINYGDFLTLICGICFAIHIVLLGRYAQIYDPVFLTVIQILAAACFGWCVAPILDGSFEFAVLADKALMGGVFYLAIFSTMVGFLLQNVGQKFLSASTAALLLSLESVFGALFSVIFLKERLTGRMVAGCVLMFVAVVLAECGPEERED